MEALKSALNFVLEVARDVFLELAGGLLGWVLFLLLLLPLFLAIYFILKRLGYGKNWNLQVNLATRPPKDKSAELLEYATRSAETPLSTAIEPGTSAPPQPSPPWLDTLDQTRNTLLPVYKALVYGVAAVLAGFGLYFAWLAAEQTEMLLVALVLFGLAAAAINTWDPKRFDRTRRSNTRSWLHVETRTSEPVVFHLASEAMDKAEEMLRQGISLDAVCREINPKYAELNPAIQGIFRKQIELALQHRESPPASS